MQPASLTTTTPTTNDEHIGEMPMRKGPAQLEQEPLPRHGAFGSFDVTTDSGAAPMAATAEAPGRLTGPQSATGEAGHVIGSNTAAGVAGAAAPAAAVKGSPIGEMMQGHLEEAVPQQQGLVATVEQTLLEPVKKLLVGTWH